MKTSSNNISNSNSNNGGSMTLSMIPASRYELLLKRVRTYSNMFDAAWYEKRLARLNAELPREEDGSINAYYREEIKEIEDTEIMLEMVRQGLHRS